MGWVVVLTAVGSVMAALDTLVVSTALSTIRLDLGASVEQLEWTVNAYNVSFAVLLITAAALGDRYGRRAFYAVAVAVFAGAGGYASPAAFLDGFARAIAAVAALALAGAIVALALPGRRRAAEAVPVGRLPALAAAGAG